MSASTTARETQPGRCDRHGTTALTEECRALQFTTKYPDVAALNFGAPELLRPIIESPITGGCTLKRVSGREVALVFGANGFVGSHLVARLSREPGIERVYAAVRSAPDTSPEARLQHSWQQYHVGEIDLDKIHVTTADVTRPHFGLPEDDYRRLADEADLVFSCASSTDYTSSYLQLRTDWFLSLLRVLQFSVERHRKHVTYLGSVGALLYRDTADFHRTDSWWYSGYSQMKWVNGALLRGMFDIDDFDVTLCEAPYILGSTTVGLDPGRHYSWWRLIDLACAVGAIWDGPGMAYVPVDVLAEVLATNAVAQAPMNYLLPCNPVGYHNDLLAELLGLRLVSWTQFVRLVSNKVSPRYRRTLLSSNFDALVRIVNAPGATLPSDHDWSWCDNRRLFSLYLDNIEFRSARRKIA